MDDVLTWLYCLSALRTSLHGATIITVQRTAYFIIVENQHEEKA